MSRPSNSIEPAVGSSSRRMQRASRGLAAAGLADEAERLAAADSKETSSTALTAADLLWKMMPLRDREVLLQVLDAGGAPSAIRYTLRVANVGSSRSRLAVLASRRRGSTPARASGAPAIGSSCGQLLAAAVHHVRAARVEPAAAGRRQQRRRRAGDLGRAARRGRRGAGSEPSRPHVYGCCGFSKSSSTGAGSTTAPAYITIISSASSATTPRSWVIMMMAMPKSSAAADQLEDLRLDGHVERRRGLVGDQQLGSLSSAIAIITRWRMPPENWCG